MKFRSEVVAQLKSNYYDVCVIGGGASGAGCALDAQLRGLKTVVLDSRDFGSATSSASTKLIHGGVRYLQQALCNCDAAQYRVMRLALRERSLMIRNASYLTGVRQFAVPCGGLSDAIYFGIGLRLYDWISGSASLSRSYFLGRSSTLGKMPWLKADRLIGAMFYGDGQFDDSRYNLALVQSCRKAGGTALSYAHVNGFEKDDRGQIVAVIAEDRESGASFRIAARCFVNATGPFSDHVRRVANPAVEERLVLSKGIHILLPLRDNFGDSALLMPDTEDGRVIFVIPWSDRLLVGTTDTESDASQEMIVTKAEAEYVLRHLNAYLTEPYELSDIVSAFAGLRPLVKGRDVRATKKLVRDYEIETDSSSGLISILGGKWTVYRAMAQDAVNAAQKKILGRVTECKTRNYRLFGSGIDPTALNKDLRKSYPISGGTAEHLVRKFGSNAVRVLDLAREDASHLSLLVDGAPQIRAEVAYCAREEMAFCIEDVLRRRLGLEFLDWRKAIQAAPATGQILGHELAWSAAQTKLEIDGYVRKIERLLRKVGLDEVQEDVLGPV